MPSFAEVGAVVMAGARRMRPPPGGAHDNAVMAWRYFIASVVSLNTMVIAAIVLLAWGWVPGLFPGFARADGQVEAMRREQLETALWQLRVQQCEAQAQSKSVIGYTEKIEDRQKQYKQLTTAPYTLPDCRDLT